jgi:NitT/TauT family transport system substrate-binding protein
MLPISDRGGGAMAIRLSLSSVAAALSLFLASAAQAEPLRIRYSIWVGYGPLFVAVEKGFFADEGVEVELIKIEDDTATLAALFAGQIDALATATQVVVSSNEPDEEALACGLMLDDSQGGDGILATKNIQTIADLKGKTVAFGHRSVSQFYINVLLKEVGLSEADIEVVDLRSDAAAEAFMMRDVDATVTWEPYLSQGRNAAHGHLLTDSSKRPGLIGDCLATKASIFNDRKQEFRAVARAWDAAVRYVDAHPAEANAIMARGMGEDPAVFAEMLRGVGLYDADENREYFGTPDQPGQIYQTMQYAIDVWTDLGVLRAKLAPADVIAHGILDE